MRVKLAKTAGFCWGVERALDIVLETANEASGPVFTHGPLIHNPPTVKLLEKKKVYATDPEAPAPDTGLVVIRAHGISPQVRERLRASGAALRDATCPLVAKVHGIIRKHARQGAATIIIGEEGHPEVEGHMGYAEAGSYLVTRVEEVERLPRDLGEVIVVAQTTLNMEEFAHVVDAIRARYPQAKMFNTICDATEERQREVRALAPKVDLMVVVGGRNSGNTKRLVEVAREEGAEAVLIETEEEVDPDFLRKFKEIGVTAGASTPDWMIRRVVNRIETIPPAENRLLERVVEWLKILSRANVLLLLAAAMGAVATAALGGFAPEGRLVALAALYLFSLHTLNRCASYEADRYNEPNRAHFFERHIRALYGAAAAAGLASLALGASISWIVAAVLAGGMALGIFYSARLEPRALHVSRAMDFPASKTLVVAVGWTVTLGVIPALAAPGPVGPALPVALLFAFSLSLIRSGIVEMRDMQGDRIVGKRTLPIVLGKEPTMTLLCAVCSALAVLLAASVVNGTLGARIGLAMLAPVAYGGFCLYLFRRKVLGHGGLTEAALDLKFIIAGLAALLAISV
ncbi:MAG: 4-hydroxy-3-methylbut-2-enyl diphosphate reductase [bacterium]